MAKLNRRQIAYLFAQGLIGTQAVAAGKLASHAQSHNQAAYAREYQRTGGGEQKRGYRVEAKGERPRVEHPFTTATPGAYAAHVRAEHFHNESAVHHQGAGRSELAYAHSHAAAFHQGMLDDMHLGSYNYPIPKGPHAVQFHQETAAYHEQFAGTGGLEREAADFHKHYLERAQRRWNSGPPAPGGGAV